MRTELDRRMDAGLKALIGAEGPLALGAVTLAGETLPMIAAAPAALPAYFAHYCAEHAAKTFLVAGDERLTFVEVHAAAQRVARALVAGYGVKVGDRIGIAMRNSPSWIVLYMAIVMAGGVATLLNGWWQSAELAAALAEVECGLVFADPPRAKRLAEVPDLTAPVVTIDDAKPLARALAEVMANAGSATPLPVLDGDTDATILFTSGSTGQSKGAISDHRAVLQAVFNYLAQALV
ncbi:MAG: AMP-binding protein, partial [Sphingomonas sp.]